MSIDKINIPIFVADDKYTPTVVSPRILFYNGTKNTDRWYTYYGRSYYSNYTYPYFDVYSENTPSLTSKSLLFYNETSVVGETPVQSVYTTFWSKYINTLYDPRLRILEGNAIIPLMDYYNLNINDVVEFRSNYYYLRTINNYNLNTGECNIELLGPIYYDTFGDLDPIYNLTPNLNYLYYIIDNFNITVYGDIISQGSSPILEVGLCYSTTNDNPTVDDSVILLEGEITKYFNITIEDAMDEVEYFVRLFARNQYGIEYTTSRVLYIHDGMLPTIQIITPEVDGEEVILKLNISYQGGSTITQAGWVYGDVPNPTITDNKTTIPVPQMGVNDKYFYDFDRNVKYYLRGFATNSYGTQYTDQIILII